MADGLSTAVGAMAGDFSRATGRAVNTSRHTVTPTRRQQCQERRLSALRLSRTQSSRETSHLGAMCIHRLVARKAVVSADHALSKTTASARAVQRKTHNKLQTADPADMWVTKVVRLKQGYAMCIYHNVETSHNARNSYERASAASERVLTYIH